MGRNPIPQGILCPKCFPHVLLPMKNQVWNFFPLEIWWRILNYRCLAFQISEWVCKSSTWSCTLLSLVSGSTTCTGIYSKVIVQIPTLLNIMSCKNNIQNFWPCNKILEKVAEWCFVCYKARLICSYFCDYSICPTMLANDYWRKIK